MRITALLLALVLAPFPALAQSSNKAQTPQPDPPHRSWHASWVTHPTAPLREPLVLHFRRSLELASVPSSYLVRVSADNRFILYVNGARVGDGPARGDLPHWRYERFDLAPLLKPGHNLITATVWNFGVFAPLAQFSDRTAFLLESEATAASGISTPKNWLVEDETGVNPLGRAKVTLQTYFASGPGEELDASKYDWSWNSEQTGTKWVPVASPMRDSIFPVNGAHSADATGDNPWGLIPDELPHMEYTSTGVGSIVSIDNIGNEQPGLSHFPGQSTQLPPNTHVSLTIDRKSLTTAYPELIVSGGKGSHIVLTYSEALYDDKKQKGDRDAVDYSDANGVKHPRKALGLTDSFLPDGGPHRVFMPLWWRTWRYLDARHHHGLRAPHAGLAQGHTSPPTPSTNAPNSKPADPISTKSGRSAGAPRASTPTRPTWIRPTTSSSSTSATRRIQALISYTVAGDDRLGRQALLAFDQSRIPKA